MFDTKNSSGCHFGDEIVTYLYGEMEAAERKAFDNHLNGCSQCPNELAAFSSVSVAINEWKSVKFDPLDSPRIAYTRELGQIDNSTSVTADAGYFKKFTGMFSELPAMWQAASAFALFIIAAGLVFYFSNGYVTPGENIAEIPPVKVETAVPPLDLKDIPASETRDVELATGAADSVDSPDEPAPVKAVNSGVQGRTRTLNKPKVRNGKRPLRTGMPEKTSPKTPLQANSVPDKLDEVPRLSDLADTEDIEDDSLRLSDLFAVSGAEDR